MSEPKVSHPVAGVDYPGTYQQLQSWFPDNASRVAYLAELRWGQGFCCPRCDFDQSWQTGAGQWMCQACGRKTSVTAGTVFPPQPHPAVDVVRRDLVPDLPEERDLSCRAAAGAGLRVV